jgi:predicted nucleotidyltransferase
VDESGVVRARFEMTDPVLIFETVHGSRAYGLETEDSDLDLRGVVVGPAAWYHGFEPTPELIELGKDHVRYEIRRFFRLAVAANPTLLELLWTDPSLHRVVTREGEALLAQRDSFLSTRVQETFVGYALSQLKRIKGHRGWLLSPPRQEPKRGDYGLPETTLIPKDQLRAAEVMIERGQFDEAELSPNCIAVMQRERAYRQARREWDHYQEWKRNRNPARAQLEARFGYDTKHAQHLVRMMRMGVEILRDGVVRVRRDDADELRAVRAGAWSYEQLIERAEALAADVRSAAAASRLPEAPDTQRLAALCRQIVESVLA